MQDQCKIFIPLDVKIPKFINDNIKSKSCLRSSGKQYIKKSLSFLPGEILNHLIFHSDQTPSLDFNQVSLHCNTLFNHECSKDCSNISVSINTNILYYTLLDFSQIELDILNPVTETEDM